MKQPRPKYRRLPCPVCGGRMELRHDLESKPLWVCTGFDILANDLCFARAVFHQHGNTNPRLGVMLRQRGASVRLSNLLCRWRMRGLIWMLKNYPVNRLRKELFGFGPKQQAEFVRLVNS